MEDELSKLSYLDLYQNNKVNKLTSWYVHTFSFYQKTFLCEQHERNVYNYQQYDYLFYDNLGIFV